MISNDNRMNPTGSMPTTNLTIIPCSVLIGVRGLKWVTNAPTAFVNVYPSLNGVIKPCGKSANNWDV